MLPVIPFQAALERYMADEQLPDYFSAAAKARVPATKTVRLHSMPPYLMVQLGRCAAGSFQWTTLVQKVF